MRIALALPLAALLACAKEPSRAAAILPARGECLRVAREKPWARGLRQIPSTVIDKGVLRHVPYVSYRAGEYELNVYGDPALPSCVEVGVHPPATKAQHARKACLEFMTALLPHDQAILESLNLEKDVKVVIGLTFEVTPETAEDAYGGWWISVYDTAALERSRATAADLKRIAASRDEVRKRDDEKRPGPAVEPRLDGRWSKDDLKDARLRGDKPEEKQEVYAPEFSRKDGAYVARPPDRREEDTGWILFICANSPKHEDREEILKTCTACGKESTFWWDAEKRAFVCFACGGLFDNAKVSCTICGRVPTRVRTKHK